MVRGGRVRLLSSHTRKLLRQIDLIAAMTTL